MVQYQIRGKYQPWMEIQIGRKRGRLDIT